MLLILFTIIIVALITYIFVKPLIDNLFNYVPHEPKYIHSYLPIIGFGFEILKNPIEFIRSLYLKYGKTFVIYLGSKRWVYLFDEQTYLTKVIKSSDLSIDDFLTDILVKGLDINRKCLTDKKIQELQVKQFHHYLVGDELEILNKLVHDSLIQSMKFDANLLTNNKNKIVNFFDFFGEFMLFAGAEGLFGHSFTSKQQNTIPSFYKLFQDFDEAYKLCFMNIPFRSILYKTILHNRNEFIKKFSFLKLNNGESKLINAREELYRSNEYKHLFREYDINGLQASMLWAAVSNTAPMACWSVVDLLLHPQALEAVKQELNDNISSSSILIYDKDVLSNLKILESCINESMRRVRNATSTRQAMVDTTIECLDKTKIGLRKGDMLVYPAFLKNLDPNLFGSNPYGYKYDRFVKKPNQAKAPSIMIFGCGTHTCPGRFWAMNEIKMLVALIIQHMDIEFIHMTEKDKDDYRKKLPYDFSKFISSGGPKKGHEHKFDIKYSYKNFDNE
ncbi:unnamed protein product [Rotaria sp. Silwood2]|nr:unnamed protein product [Rotaria sp. Silwood2]CAF4111129.1 unnamed protein product [Rotaria sp. Silwood2]